MTAIIVLNKVYTILRHVYSFVRFTDISCCHSRYLYTPVRQDVAEFAELYNPKQEIIRQSFGMEKQESEEIEIFDNIWLSSWEHGYFD